MSRRLREHYLLIQLPARSPASAEGHTARLLFTVVVTVLDILLGWSHML